MIDLHIIAKTIWHKESIEKSLEILQVDQETGLSVAQVEERSEIFGPNQIIDQGGKSIWKMLYAQLTDTMVLVLLGAAVLSAIVSDWKDAVAISVIVILNAVIGLVQEYRAEQAMAALKQLASPSVRVKRNGKLEDLDAKHLVPGDIISLEAGSKVPADARVLETANLRVEEASLTGESAPVDKSLAPLDQEDTPLGDRTNLLFTGTTVTYGRGTAVVIKTGMETELGRIAEMIQTVVEEQTPLQKRMDRMGKTLALAALGIVILVFSLGLLRGENPSELFLTAIAMAVAAVPEGLPAVVAIALALGAQRMLKRQALIRKLPAVETLGSVTVIASDKTGTLTANQMQIKVLDVAGNRLSLDWHPGETIEEDPDHTLDPATRLLLIGGVLNNDAQLVLDETRAGEYMILGDPTEGALISAGANYGYLQKELNKLFPRRDEVPFSSERKRMSTLHELKDGSAEILPEGPFQQDPLSPNLLSFTKGSVDGLIEISTHVYVDGEIIKLNPEWKTRIDRATEELAGDGLRVLGLGFKIVPSTAPEIPDDQIENGLIFVGLFGMMDPPRQEAFESVQINKGAGIRTLMITGDHPLTAQRIAWDLKISDDGEILTGQQLSHLDDDDLRHAVSKTNVYARVSPEHKLRIVAALQDLGEVVAMTGDGVNDAPALRKADIGVAMGITGTDVSKEASDMVLLDDNFATIVQAVREGRTIFENIKKFIKYTMTSNVGEVLVMLLAPFLGMPLPLTALQILWVNLVTDGLPGLALSVEPTEEDIMNRPPIDIKQSIFAGGMSFHIVWVGFLIGIVSLATGYWAWANGNPYWGTMVFTTLTLSQMGNALAVRSETHSLFKQGILSNKFMLASVLLTLGLQMFITYWAPIQNVFNTQPLPLRELGISLGASSLVFVAIEIQKFFKRRRRSSGRIGS